MSPGLAYLLIGLIVGGALGFLVGWLYRRGQAVAPDDRLASELRQQLTQREGELANLREQLTRASETAADAKAKREAAESLVNDQRALHERAMARQRRHRRRRWLICARRFGR